MNKDSQEPGLISMILGSTKYKMFNFMVSIVLLLILSAVLQGVNYGYYVLNISSNIVFLLGVYAIGKNKRTIILLLILGLPWVFSDWFFTSSTQSIFASILYFFVVTSILLSHILKAKDVTPDTLYGAVCVYLLLGLLWMTLYGCIEYFYPGAVFVSDNLMDPAHISTNELIYYSYTTLSTLGYGDITSTTPLGRVLSVLEAIAGQLFIAVLIARLVSLYTAKALQKG